MSAIAPEIAPNTKSITAYGPARSTVTGTPLDADALRKTDAYWRACNYLSLGMIYLLDNPLLRSRSAPSTSRTACSATGDRAPACPSSTST